MAGDHTVKGLLNERPDVPRDELPFATKPSSGIFGDRTVNTYGTLHDIEKGRTLEAGTQEGACDLDPGEVQETAISRPSVGTNPAWNGGAGAPKPGGSGSGGSGSGPGATHLARSSGDRQQDATADAGSESNEVEGAGSGSSSTPRKATSDGTTTTQAKSGSGKGAKGKDKDDKS